MEHHRAKIPYEDLAVKGSYYIFLSLFFASFFCFFSNITSVVCKNLAKILKSTFNLFFELKSKLPSVEILVDSVVNVDVVDCSAFFSFGLRANGRNNQSICK